MSDIDTNVENYSLSELLVILNIDNVEPNEITKKTNYLINKYKTKNPELSVFFQNVQSQLLQYSQGLSEYEEDSEADYKINVEGFNNMSMSMSNEAIYPVGERQISDWYQNEYLTQDDENQTNKITNRQQKINVFGNNHSTMNREQIATTDTYQVPVKQDSLNPNLKNTISRFINLDSQFRQYSNGISSSSTDYTLDLSDTLKDAISIRLYSYQIPYSWYTIDIAYGNTCFWISDPSSNNIVNISVTPGNYNQSGFISQLNTSFSQAGFLFPSTIPVNTPASLNNNNGIITLNLYGGTWSDGYGNAFTISTNTKIIFYDFTGILQCNNSCLSKTNSYFNNTLGWIMGYKLPYVFVDPSGNSASSILDLNGPKYLILVIDDFNQNHVNNSLVSISQYSNTLKMPSYYSPDLPYTCVTPGQQFNGAGNNLEQLVSGVIEQSLFDEQTTDAQNGLLIAGKYQQDYATTQQVLPSAPRTLTASQIYTINSINNNNNNLTNYLSKAPTSSDILGILPIKTSTGVPTGSLIVDFSGSLQDNVRNYFGPVNIERMAVKLLDDKGNVLNLNGNDWCVTLVCDCLYQY